MISKGPELSLIKNASPYIENIITIMLYDIIHSLTRKAKMFYIYKITNLINSKSYIGKTNNLQLRWKSHRNEAKLQRKKYPLYLAMNKYGIDNFSIEKIEELDDETFCFDREKYWIEYYRTNISKYGNQFGYNLTEGGEGVSGYVYTIAQKEIRSVSKMGMKNPFFGRRHSVLSKKQISNSRIGKITLPETKEKISRALKGLPKTVETRMKMSASAFGKTKSPQHCKNISSSKLGKSNNRPGEKHHNAKLQEQDVIDIRYYFDNSKEKSKDKIELLSKQYNLSKSGIQQIVYRVKWKHIP